jgi:hypothetical protein
MKIHTLLLLGLAAGVPAATLLSAAPAALAAGDDIEQLEASYDEALAVYKEAFDEAELAERKALRSSHPAILVWAKFEALGASGEGRALLWMAEHTREKGLSKKERGPVKRDLYQRILTDHLEEPWARRVISMAVRDHRDVGREEVLDMLKGVTERAKEPTLGLLATLKTGELLAASKEPEQKKEGEAILAAYQRKHLSFGAEAIDFPGQTVDGHPFRLSDYRGKAVLIDFYGFW